MKKLVTLLTIFILVSACSPSNNTPVPEASPVDAVPTAQAQSPEPAPTSQAEPPAAEDQPQEPTPTPQESPEAEDQPTESAPTPQVEPEASPPAVNAPASVAEILAGLEELALDEFFEESFKQLTLRSPEAVTEAGLAKELGMRNDKLDDLSDIYVRETGQLEVGIFDLLRAWDRDSLTPEQRISYDVYTWWLENRVEGHAFMYHEYSLHHFIRSYHFNLDALFSETQPLENKQDVEDYISRLFQVLRQTEQLMERLAIQEEMGIIPPKFVIQLARSDIYEYLGLRSPDLSALQAESLVMYTRLDLSLDEIPDLSAEERQGFRADALEAVNSSIIPAYGLMVAYLDQVEPLAPDDAGVWQLPDGDAYYAYMLRQETSTDLTPQEIHELGLSEVERIQAEMRVVVTEMGYPEDAPLGDVMQEAVDDFGYYNISTPGGQAEYLGEIERVIAEADQRVAEVFDLKPHYPVGVIAGEYGGYYMAGSADGSRPGSYHVSTRGQWRPKYALYTVAYHETTPGHHYQIATAQGLDLPSLRSHLVFNAYAEGWALYAEYLVWELGLYEENPYGNLGRLQYELLRAVRLVTDTGIHAMGWTRAEAKAYMDEAMSPPWFSHEVDRYVVLPAQATGYKVGMLKIMELRQRAMEALGSQFDIKEFHNVVIGNGSLPLEILERVVDDWIEAENATLDPAVFELKSPAFGMEEPIPALYTCSGQDISPPLEWGAPPEGTQSLVLLVEDISADDLLVHWILFNIPPETRSLPERVATLGHLADGSQQGTNNIFELGYFGPCPPPKTHRYRFTLYALDTMLDLDDGVMKIPLKQAMRGHDLAVTELIGTYSR